ncbi:MAG: HAMP domain-containing histidine kinase [Chloroflexi bacterium]|nr:HAMP domain-containing histidine kinase [Chloroflexota bacterium]
MNRPNGRLQLYVCVVLALGLGMLALGFLQLPAISVRAIGLAACLALLIALAGAYPIPLSPKVKANVVTAPLFAAVVLLQPVVAMATAVVGVTASEIMLRRRPHNVLFNGAAAAIYAGAAAFAYVDINPSGRFFTWPYGIGGALAAAATVYLMNRAIVVIAAGVESGKSPFWLWRKGWKRDLAQEVALSSLGYAGALSVYVAPWSLVFLVAPVVVIYKAFAKVTALSCELENQMVQLKAAEAQLVQAAKMASLGTLTAGIGHQINNPIFVIKGRAELLLEGADRHIKSDKARQHVEVIREMADRVSRIVRCLLTSSKPSEDGSSYTDANDALESMLLLLESKVSKSRVVVNKDYQQPSPKVPGDPVEIQEMLGNLISNACDAMPGGGQLLLATRCAGRDVVIEVSDTGAGISETDLSRVFDPFFTTKETSGGTGLGLYVVKNIAQKHGGTVEVESQQGRGTTFRITLPVVEGDTRHPEDRMGRLIKLR